jgi:hypothetical protein
VEPGEPFGKYGIRLFSVKWEMRCDPSGTFEDARADLSCVAGQGAFAGSGLSHPPRRLLSLAQTQDAAQKDSSTSKQVVILSQEKPPRFLLSAVRKKGREASSFSGSLRHGWRGEYLEMRARSAANLSQAVAQGS